jgi:hypothetical protein
MIRLYCQFWKESFTEKDIYSRALAQIMVLMLTALFALLSIPVVIVGGGLLEALWRSFFSIAP